jgi:hypothetical protein
VKFVLVIAESRLAMGTSRSAVLRVPGGLSLGVSRQGLEANHSSSWCVEAKNIGVITSTPLHFNTKHIHIFTRNFIIFKGVFSLFHLLCGLVVRVLGYRSRGPGSIPGTTRKK